VVTTVAIDRLVTSWTRKHG